MSSLFAPVVCMMGRTHRPRPANWTATSSSLRSQSLR